MKRFPTAPTGPTAHGRTSDNASPNKQPERDPRFRTKSLHSHSKARNASALRASVLLSLSDLIVSRFPEKRRCSVCCRCPIFRMVFLSPLSIPADCIPASEPGKRLLRQRRDAFQCSRPVISRGKSPDPAASRFLQRSALLPYRRWYSTWCQTYPKWD